MNNIHEQFVNTAIRTYNLECELQLPIRACLHLIIDISPEPRSPLSGSQQLSSPGALAPASRSTAFRGCNDVRYDINDACLESQRITYHRRRQTTVRRNRSGPHWRGVFYCAHYSQHSRISDSFRAGIAQTHSATLCVCVYVCVYRDRL